MRELTYPTGQRLQLIQGDITQQDVDTIINAANARLQHGGGVAGVIVQRGGRGIQVESTQWVRKYGPVGHADPAFTTGGDLPCRYVIHAVGPVWGEGDEDNKLTVAVKGSLRRADELELESIAIPAISTGIFGFPKARAAKIIFEAVETYFVDYPGSGLTLVRFVLFDQPTLDIFIQIWDSLFEAPES